MRINHEVVKECCDIMDGASGSIKEILDSVKGTLSSLETSDCWQGSGYTYYYSKLKNVTEKFDTVTESIDNNIVYLKEALDSYGDLDKRVISGFFNWFDVSKWGD